MCALKSFWSLNVFILFFRKESEDWGWGEDSGWSDAKSSSSIDKTASKKTTTSSSSTVGGLAAKKKSEKSKNEPKEPANLLIDFGGASSAAKGIELLS